MSTRSYVGIIDDGVVTYGYHHSDSHLESLGIELYQSIKENCDAHKLKDFAEEPFDKMDEKAFFNYTARDIFIEFCYGFNLEDEQWYVSSRHFEDDGKTHKLTEVVKDDEVMQEYLSMYYEKYRAGTLEQIRKGIA